MSTNQTTPSLANNEELVLRLELVLRDMCAEHQSLLSQTEAHRSALARADGAALRRCVGQQSETLQRIAQLEKQRALLVGQLAARLDVATPERGAQRPLTVSAIGAVLPAAFRERLTAAAAQLRGIIARLHGELATLGAASEALAVHMEGIMKQVGRRLSHSGVYARPGAAPPSAQVVSALDLRL